MSSVPLKNIVEHFSTLSCSFGGRFSGRMSSFYAGPTVLRHVMSEVQQAFVSFWCLGAQGRVGQERTSLTGIGRTNKQREGGVKEEAQREEQGMELV